MPSPSDASVTIAARGQRRAPQDAPIDRLSASLPGPLARVPVAILSSWVGAIAVALVVSLSVLARSPKAIELLEEDEVAIASASASAPSAEPVAPPAPAKPAVPKATSAELSAARLAGAEALAQLAQRFPEDPEVLRELFLAHAASPKSHAAAVRAARKLIELSPEAGDDDDVRRALVAIANAPGDAAAVTLDLMANDMGRRGAELLFEVANGAVMSSKLKAAKLLADPEIRKNATPALLIANDLRASFPCARKALLPRARAESDARSIPFLKPLLNTACGGFFSRGAECYRCFTPADRAEIQSIVETIEARSGASVTAGSGAPRASAAPSASAAP